jgi:myo-inositol-1(or 4)-monophosphatase
MVHTPVMTVMIGAVRKAARGVQRDYGEVSSLQVSQKGPGDFVTAADQKCEQTLRAELSKARPDYGFLGEEQGETKGKDPEHRFIIDPIDGTHNFMHAIPYFALSVALERRGEIVAAVIYNPISDELFHAEKGTGAFCNNKRMRVGGRSKLLEAMTVTNIPHRGQRDLHIRHRNEVAVMQAKSGGVRALGAAALDLAYLALGRFDAAWTHDLKIWDVAAGVLLVRESGGFVHDLYGNDNPLTSGGFVAANADLLPQMKSALTEAAKI